MYLLSQVVTVDYQQDHVRVFLGFQKPNLTAREKSKKKLADDVPVDEATKMIIVCNDKVILIIAIL